MKVVVLEPSGKHWATDIPEDRLSATFTAIDTDDPAFLREVEGIRRPGGELLPTMTLVHYQGHAIVDGDGTEYWVFVRRRGPRPLQLRSQ